MARVQRRGRGKGIVYLDPAFYNRPFEDQAAPRDTLPNRQLLYIVHRVVSCVTRYKDGPITECSGRDDAVGQFESPASYAALVVPGLLRYLTIDSKDVQTVDKLVSSRFLVWLHPNAYFRHGDSRTVERVLFSHGCKENPDVFSTSQEVDQDICINEEATHLALSVLPDFRSFRTTRSTPLFSSG